MHVNANPRKCQKVVQPPGLTTNQQQWLEAWQHLRAHTLAKTATHFRYHFVSALTYTYERYFRGAPLDMHGRDPDISGFMCFD